MGNISVIRPQPFCRLKQCIKDDQYHPGGQDSRMATTRLVDCEAATPHSHQPVTAEVVSLAGQEGSAVISALRSHVLDRLSNSLNMEADM